MPAKPDGIEWGMERGELEGKEKPPKRANLKDEGLGVHWTTWFCAFHAHPQTGHKSLKYKTKLGKKLHQNRGVPQWFRMQTHNRISYNFKRRHWARRKMHM